MLGSSITPRLGARMRYRLGKGSIIQSSGQVGKEAVAPAEVCKWKLFSSSDLPNQSSMASTKLETT